MIDLTDARRMLLQQCANLHVTIDEITSSRRGRVLSTHRKQIARTLRGAGVRIAVIARVMNKSASAISEMLE